MWGGGIGVARRLLGIHLGSGGAGGTLGPPMLKETSAASPPGGLGSPRGKNTSLFVPPAGLRAHLAGCECDIRARVRTQSRPVGKKTQKWTVSSLRGADFILCSLIELCPFVY